MIIVRDLYEQMDDNGVREWPRGHGAASDEPAPCSAPSSFEVQWEANWRLHRWRWLQAGTSRAPVALLVSYMRAHYSLSTIRAIMQIALIDKRAPIILIFVV